MYTMKWLFLPVLILFLLSPGSTVTFIVLDSHENPVEGADIYFCARKAVTDHEGTAAFEDIPDLSNTPYGGCTLEITKEGYLTVTDAFAVTEDMVLTYVLYSEIMATVSGIVYFDSSDNPAAFVALRVYDVLTGEQLPSVLTNGEGRFTFQLSVDRSVYIIVSDYENQKFYVTAEKEQVLVVNTKGIVTDVEITVRDDRGRPLEGVSVMLQSDVVHNGSTNTKGTVMLTEVINGEYTLILEKEGYVTITEDISVISPERGGVYHLDFVMEKAHGTVTVQVFSQSGEPLTAQVGVTAEGKEILQKSVEGSETIILEPGQYTFTVDAMGFEPVTRQVLVLEGRTTSVDFELEKSQRTVKVTTERFPVEIVVIVCAAGVILVLLYLWKR